MNHVLFFSVLFCSILFCSDKVYSQSKKCRFSLDEVDEFSKLRKVRTKEEVLYDNLGSTLMAAYVGIDNDFRLKVSVAADYLNGKKSVLLMVNSNSDLVANFSKVDFLLMNGSVLRMDNLANNNFNISGGGILYWKFYIISEQDWETFKLHSIKKIRVYMSNGRDKTLEIPASNSDKLSKALQCLDSMNLPENPSSQSNKETTVDDEISQETPIIDVAPIESKPIYQENSKEAPIIEQSYNGSKKGTTREQSAPNLEKENDHSENSSKDVLNILCKNRWLLQSLYDAQGGLVQVNYSMTFSFTSDGGYEFKTKYSNGKTFIETGKYLLNEDNSLILSASNSDKVNTINIIRITEMSLQMQNEKGGYLFYPF